MVGWAHTSYFLQGGLYSGDDDEQSRQSEKLERNRNKMQASK